MFSAWSRDDDEMDRSLSIPSHLELTLSSSVVAIPPTSPEAQEPLEDLQFANADDDHEYACKYCHKKFSNKQALGGHQNAHKMERAMDKGAGALTENQFGYFNFDGPSSYPLMEAPLFVRPLNNRSHEFLSGATVNLPQHPPPVHQEVHMGQFARSLHPTDGMPYAPCPVPGLAHIYPGWNAPVPSMYRFVAPPSHLQYDAPNPGNLPYGFGSSSAQPVFDAHPTCTGSGPITDEDLGHQNNNQMNNPENEVEDPDLDLSLRL